MFKHKQKQIVIVGGGHNGLVCACYLAEAGHQVTILEKNAQVGGAAITEEFYPGFKNSVASYAVGLLHPQVIEDLKLHQHGLKVIERPISNFLPFEDGQYLKLGSSLDATQAQFSKFSKLDAAQLPAYYKMLEGVIGVVKQLMFEAPLNISAGMGEAIKTALTAKKLRKMDSVRQQDILDLFTLSAAELLSRWFESDEVKAAFAFDAIIGNYASPYTPGSAYVLLHHVVGETNGKAGAWGHAIGGMGSITQAMARRAESMGVNIFLNAQVKSIRSSSRQMEPISVEYHGVGKHKIQGDIVAANVTPNMLFEQLLDKNQLPAPFKQRIGQWHCESATFRMNVALSELPDFIALPGKQLAEHHQSGIVIGPSLDYLDAAHKQAMHDGFSNKPFIEMLIPSTLDNSLAPKGQHVASLFCQHFPFQLPNGRKWHVEKPKVIKAIINTVNQYAPNFSESVLAVQALSPVDLEKKFGLTRGDIFHGALRLNQLYHARPAVGYSDYRTPVENVYLCGSGAHPGGGVSGLPGRNCALRILKDC